LIKDLTQLLVDRFVTTEELVDFLTARQHLSKSQRVKVIPLFTKYRASPNLRESYISFLTQLQQGLEEQLTSFQDIKENLASLTKLLYYMHRSDREPLERKGRIVKGDLQMDDTPYSCSVLPSLDRLYRELLTKPKHVKG
jgi:hypothetical protein